MCKKNEDRALAANSLFNLGNLGSYIFACFRCVTFKLGKFMNVNIKVLLFSGVDGFLPNGPSLLKNHLFYSFKKLIFLPPTIGIESLAATADSTLGNNSSDLFRVKDKQTDC